MRATGRAACAVKSGSLSRNRSGSHQSVRSSTTSAISKHMAFFIGRWDLIAGLEVNFESDGYPRDAVHEFIVDASSSFYAQFGELVHARVDEWLDTVDVVS